MLFISKLTSFLSFFFASVVSPTNRFGIGSLTQNQIILQKHTNLLLSWREENASRSFFFVLIMDLNTKLAWGIHLIPHDMPNRFVQSIYTAHIQLVFSLVFVYSECFTWKLHLIFTLWMLFAYEMLSQASHSKFYWCWKIKVFHANIYPEYLNILVAYTSSLVSW